MSARTASVSERDLSVKPDLSPRDLQSHQSKKREGFEALPLVTSPTPLGFGEATLRRPPPVANDRPALTLTRDPPPMTARTRRRGTAPAPSRAGTHTHGSRVPARDTPMLRSATGGTK